MACQEAPEAPELAPAAKKRRLGAPGSAEAGPCSGHASGAALHGPTRADSPSVRLDIGGTVHRTLRETASRLGVVQTALSISRQQKDFYFDRSGRLFGQVLDFYRNNCRLPAGLPVPELRGLKYEAKYFDCPALLTEIEHLYAPREAVRQVKSVGGTALAAAYHTLAMALCQHDSPHYAEVKLRRAEALDGDRMQSLRFYQAWVKRCPKEADAWLGLGTTLDTLGDLKLAHRAFCNALQLRACAAAHTGCARALGRQRHFAAAEDHYVQALRLMQQGMGTSRELLASTYASHGNVCDQQRKLLAAKNSYFEATRHQPNVSMYHSLLARVLWLQRDFDAALASVSTAIDLDRESGDLQLLLGRIEQDRQNLPQAKLAFTAAARRLPDHPEPLWALANVLGAQGNFAEMEEALLRLVALAPERGDYWAELGRVALLQQKFADAEDAYSRAVELEVTNSGYYLQLGRAREKLGNLIGAGVAYSASTEFDPTSTAALLHLGSLRIKLKMWAAAEAPLQQAIALGEPSAVPHLKLGIACFNLGKAAQAEEHVLRATQIEGDNAGHHLQLGNICVHRKKYSAAQAAYSRACELAAQEPEPNFHLGRVQMLLGDRAAAEEAFGRAVALRQDHVPYRQHLASCLLKLQKFAAAQQQFLGCAAREPHVFLHHLGLASAYRSLRQTADAEAALQRASVLRPTSAAVHLEFGRLYFDTGRFAAAEQAYLRATQLDPVDAHLFYYLGSARAKQGNLAAAEPAYARACALKQPESPQYYGQLGLCRFLLGNFRTAEEPLRRAVQLNPQDIYYYLPLSRVLSWLGEPSEAAAFALQATQIEPTDAACWSQLGASLAKAGRYCEAVDAVRRAVHLSPWAPEHRKNLDAVLAGAAQQARPR